VQVLLSFLVAPAAFRLLERPQAVRLMEGLFPGYYAVGIVTIAAALGVLLLLAVVEPGASLRWGAGGLLVAALAGTVYAGHVLLPQAHAARLRAEAARAGDLAPLEFSRLHRQAVAVNIAIFGVALGALVLHAASGPRR
jgi:hypothetical protein